MGKLKIEWIGKFTCWVHFDNPESIDYLVGRGLPIVAFGNGGYGHNRVYFSSYPKSMKDIGITKEIKIE